MLFAVAQFHPCVAFLPGRTSGCPTQAFKVPQTNQYFRGSYPGTSVGPQAPAKACRRPGRRQQSHHYQLGTQRILPGNSLHSCHPRLLGIQPTSSGSNADCTVCLSKKNAGTVTTKGVCVARAGREHGARLGSWRARTDWQEPGADRAFSRNMWA